MNQPRILPSTLQVLKPLSKNKPIYTTYDDPTLFIKILSTNNRSKNDILHEIRMQKKAYKLGVPCPKIKEYFWYQNKMYIIMERIKGSDLYSLFGYNPKHTPNWIWKNIHNIINTLYQNEIEYPDITPYNFMKGTDGSIYIVDFEHSNITDHEDVDWFVQEILNGTKSWNPDFE